MFEEISAEHIKDFALAIQELGADKTDGVPNYGTALERINVGIINAEGKAVRIQEQSVEGCVLDLVRPDLERRQASDAGSRWVSSFRRKRNEKGMAADLETRWERRRRIRSESSKRGLGKIRRGNGVPAEPA